MIFHHLASERARANQECAGVIQHRAHRITVGGAAWSHPVPVPTLNGHDVRHTKAPARHECGVPGWIAILRVQQGKRRSCMLDAHSIHQCVHVALEIAAVSLAHRFESDHAHSRHLRRRSATIHSPPGRVGAILRDHRHVVAGGHELAEQVGRIHAHAADCREEAARQKADAHRRRGPFCGCDRRTHG